MPNGKVCWWFVLHDDEASLQAIDGKWEQVKLQTSWKLEPCFRLSPAPPVQPPAPPSGSSIGVVGAPVSETLTTAGVLSTTPVLSTSPQPASSQPQASTSPQTQCSTPPQLQTPPVTSDASNVPNGGNMSFLANSLEQ